MGSWQMIHNIPQPEFEAFVAHHLENDPNVRIRKGVGFVSCEQVCPLPTRSEASVADKSQLLQFADQVITTVEERETKTTYKIRSRHVIGCDGAKSQVRKSLGIESEGEDSCKNAPCTALSLVLAQVHWLTC